MNTTNPHVARECDRSDETCALEPQSPSSSSSSEAERDYPPLPEMIDLGDSGASNYGYSAECMRAYVDADRAARATPPSLPIDFKQASEQGTVSADLYLQLADAMGYESGKDGMEFSPEEWAAALLKDALAYRASRPHPEEGALLLGGNHG